MSRILYVLDYLSHNTDAEKGATLKEIQAYLLNQTNLGAVSVLSIKRDIERLVTMGYTVGVRKGAHNTAYYYMKERGFTFNEIRFLVDSVSINKFLNNEQKQRLFKKFEGLCSEAEVRKLVGRITLSEVAPPSLDLLDNLECVHQIIAEKRKINFKYGKYNTNRVIEYYTKKRNLIPCQVVYTAERFYLKVIVEDTGNVRNYRIDRMKDITAGERVDIMPKLSKAEGFSADIFVPEVYEDVQLRVKRVLLDDMIEQLGNYAHVREDETDPENYILVRAKMGISHGLYRWIMKYGAAMEVLAPETLRQEMAKRLHEAYQQYEK